MDGNKDESGQAAFVSNVRYAYTTNTSVTAQIGRSRILLIDLPQPSASVGKKSLLVRSWRSVVPHPTPSLN